MKRLIYIVFLLFGQATASYADTELPITVVRPTTYDAYANIPVGLTHEKAIRQVPAINPGEYFVPPAVGDIPTSKYGDMVKLGRNIFIDTQHYAKRYVGNGLNCSNCHLQEGRKPYASPMWAAYPMYPMFRNKSRDVQTFEGRVQDCFRFSMNGIAPTLDSPEIKALTAYAHWLSLGAPINKELPGRGFARLAKPRDPTPVNGEKLYKEECATCHGLDGKGQKFTNRDGYMFPPLWGGDSFNHGAGMSSVKDCAQFSKANMPLGKGWTLTDMEAWDICTYIWLQDRPWDPRFGWFFNIFAPPTGGN
ncbi:MAG: c-type cytochrome [Sulfuriferula sp.]|nr:c-type cytochrome [Sulfuriferula sp.]